MPLKVCNMRGCPYPAAPGKGRCVEHHAEQRRQNRSVYEAFYSGKAWGMTRKRQLFDHPLCEYELEDGGTCGNIADSVHHIRELTAGGAPRDPANLLSVCRRHHSIIHAQRRHRDAA
jgi:hypothetical protein